MNPLMLIDITSPSSVKLGNNGMPTGFTQTQTLAHINNILAFAVFILGIIWVLAFIVTIIKFIRNLITLKGDNSAGNTVLLAITEVSSNLIVLICIPFLLAFLSLIA